MTAVVVTSEPTASAYELPPAGGLTLTEAFAALSKSGLGFSPSAVISARVERFGEVTSQPFVTDFRDEWVWAIAIRGFLFYPSPCGNCPSPPMTDITTEMFILDFNTGAYLGGWGPAFP